MSEAKLVAAGWAKRASLANRRFGLEKLASERRKSLGVRTRCRKMKLPLNQAPSVRTVKHPKADVDRKDKPELA